MRVLLIGYRGAGKSTAGMLLAEKLKLPFLSLDAEIENCSGQTIGQMVEEKGWEAFRTLESEVLVKNLKLRNGIIDCGGGIIEREENRVLLQKESRVFFLKASVEVIQERLSDKTNRPSLTGSKSFLDEIREVYQRRLPFYEACAAYTVNADESPEATCFQILQILNRQKKSDSRKNHSGA